MELGSGIRDPGVKKAPDPDPQDSWQPIYRGIKHQTRCLPPHPTSGWQVSFLQIKIDNSPGERSGLRGVEAWTATQQLYTAADDKQDLLDVQQVLGLDKTQGVIPGIYRTILVGKGKKYRLFLPMFRIRNVEWGTNPDPMRKSVPLITDPDPGPGPDPTRFFSGLQDDKKIKRYEKILGVILFGRYITS